MGVEQNKLRDKLRSFLTNPIAFGISQHPTPLHVFTYYPKDHQPRTFIFHIPCTCSWPLNSMGVRGAGLHSQKSAFNFWLPTIPQYSQATGSRTSTYQNPQVLKSLIKWCIQSALHTFPTAAQMTTVLYLKLVEFIDAKPWKYGGLTLCFRVNCNCPLPSHHNRRMYSFSRDNFSTVSLNPMPYIFSCLFLLCYVFSVSYWLPLYSPQTLKTLQSSRSCMHTRWRVHTQSTQSHTSLCLL